MATLTQSFLKWFLEVANQEYYGHSKDLTAEAEKTGLKLYI